MIISVRKLFNYLSKVRFETLHMSQQRGEHLSASTAHRIPSEFGFLGREADRSRLPTLMEKKIYLNSTSQYDYRDILIISLSASEVELQIFRHG